MSALESSESDYGVCEALLEKWASIPREERSFAGAFFEAQNLAQGRAHIVKSWFNARFQTEFSRIEQVLPVLAERLVTQGEFAGFSVADGISPALAGEAEAARELLGAVQETKTEKDPLGRVPSSLLLPIPGPASPQPAPGPLHNDMRRLMAVVESLAARIDRMEGRSSTSKSPEFLGESMAPSPDPRSPTGQSASRSARVQGDLQRRVQGRALDPLGAEAIARLHTAIDSSSVSHEPVLDLTGDLLPESLGGRSAFTSAIITSARRKAGTRFESALEWSEAVAKSQQRALEELFLALDRSDLDSVRAAAELLSERSYLERQVWRVNERHGWTPALTVWDDSLKLVAEGSVLDIRQAARETTYRAEALYAELPQRKGEKRGSQRSARAHGKSNSRSGAGAAAAGGSDAPPSRHQRPQQKGSGVAQNP